MIDVQRKEFLSKDNYLRFLYGRMNINNIKVYGFNKESTAQDIENLKAKKGYSRMGNFLRYAGLRSHNDSNNIYRGNYEQGLYTDTLFKKSYAEERFKITKATCKHFENNFDEVLLNTFKQKRDF